MNHQNTLKFPVVITSKPYERSWESKEVDAQTGKKKTGSVSVIRGILIPENAEADPSTLKEVEFNISTNKNYGAKKSAFDIMDVYYENKDKFAKGEVYAEVETYMGPRLNNQGVVSFFSPWIHDLKIVNTNEEDKSLVGVVTTRGEQL